MLWRSKLFCQVVVLLCREIPVQTATPRALQEEIKQTMMDFAEQYDDIEMDPELPDNFTQFLVLALMANGVPADDINSSVRASMISKQAGVVGEGIVGVTDTIAQVAAGADSLSENRRQARECLRRGDIAGYRRCVAQIKETLRNRSSLSPGSFNQQVTGEQVMSMVNTGANIFQTISGFLNSGQ